MLVIQSCLTLCDPMDCVAHQDPLSVRFFGKNTGVGCHFLLQGIFQIQGSNLGLLHCRQILYHLSHQGSPRKLVFTLAELCTPPAGSTCSCTLFTLPSQTLASEYRLL